MQWVDDTSANPDLTPLFTSKDRRRSPVPAVVTTIPFIIGTGTAVLSTGKVAVVPIHFRARIVSIQIQEFDGLTGSVALDIGKAFGGPNPVFVSMVGTSQPRITNGRCYPALSGTGAVTDQALLDATIAGFTNTNLVRGEFLALAVSSVSTFRRLSVSIAIRRR